VLAGAPNRVAYVRIRLRPIAILCTWSSAAGSPSSIGRVPARRDHYRLSTVNERQQNLYFDASARMLKRREGDREMAAPLDLGKSAISG